MSDNIIIRKANESDLEGILALISLPEIDNGNVMNLREAIPVYQSILDDSNYFQIVASSEQGIIGMVTLVIIMQMTHEGATTALITDLIITPEENSAAIAPQLLQYSTDLAQEYGCFKTILHCDYHDRQSTSACQELGLKKSTPCYLLSEQS
ncbi:MAG: GNAT family N-acetyltransferase [Gammaproteobacteria bacterium]|nr:GNAT family N-acetyltransferase [Gammaproteobacteria bacterium]